MAKNNKYNEATITLKKVSNNTTSGRGYLGLNTVTVPMRNVSARMAVMEALRHIETYVGKDNVKSIRIDFTK